MKKTSFLFVVFLSLLFVAGCGKQTDETLLATGSVQWFTTTYVVWSSPSFQTSLYGTVIADTTKNVVTNRWGILEYIDCQPGKAVSKNTIIAKIQANPDDVSYQNNEIQLAALHQQLNNLTTIYAFTEDTLALQRTILQDQYDNNIQLFENLEKSKSYTNTSLSYQADLLEQQYDTLTQSKSVDLSKMKTSITNAYKQYLIMIKDSLKKVNDIFSATSFSVSDKDVTMKQQVLSEYSRLKNKVSTTMSADDFSQYLSDMSDLMALAASSISATTPSSALPQSSNVWVSIDGLYTTFTTLSTTFISSKSAFDTLASSYDSVKNTYNGQIKTLDINTDTFDDSTSKSTSLQIDNQIANLQLAQKTLQHQISSSSDSQAIQLTTLKNQLITMKQNIDVLSNSLGGEVLYAGVDGVVKMRALGEDNKVAPNTLLCQISPKDPSNLSIQIYSYQQLQLGSAVWLSTYQWQFLWTWVIVYEYPYKDPTTQNYIYEIPVVKFALKENERVVISLSQKADQNDIWIPLQYISPRLEGNVVRRKNWSGVQNVYVTLWNINDAYVQILSWLNIGDEIVN